MAKFGTNLGSNADEFGPKPEAMAQNKARRAHEIDFLQLPSKQKVGHAAMVKRKGQNLILRCPSSAPNILFERILRLRRRAKSFESGRAG
jgi:hypothetical protein